MRLMWTGANVVLVAQNHNPTIVAPGWVQAHRVIEEPPENFTLTPIFALYLSTTYQLLVEPERLQFALRVLSESNLDGLASGPARYIEELPHVPYRAVGINLSWRAASERPDEVQHLLGAEITERERNAFPDGMVKKGILLLQTTDQYRLKLVATPTHDDGVDVDFNFHFEVADAQRALQAVAQVRQCYEASSRAIHRLFGLEVNA